MIYPSIDKLLNIVDSKYKLVHIVADRAKLEKSIKRYIDGIVDGIVTDVVHSGMNKSDFNTAVDGLFDAAYQQMEELK